MTSRANPASPLPPGEGNHLSIGAGHGLAVRYAVALSLGYTRLLRGVGSALAADYEVGKDYPSRLWAEVSEQLADGRTLDQLPQAPDLNVFFFFFSRSSSLGLGGKGLVRLRFYCRRRFNAFLTSTTRKRLRGCARACLRGRTRCWRRLGPMNLMWSSQGFYRRGRANCQLCSRSTRTF